MTGPQRIGVWGYVIAFIIGALQALAVPPIDAAIPLRLTIFALLGGGMAATHFVELSGEPFGWKVPWLLCALAGAYLRIAVLPLAVAEALRHSATLPPGA